MATEIKTIKNTSITRFIGYPTEGSMLQLTISNETGCSYERLTRKEVKKLIKVLSESFDYKKYPSA